MLDIGTDEDSATPGGLDRRQALKRLSAGVAGAAALGGLAAGGLGLSSQPAVAASGLRICTRINPLLRLGLCHEPA